MAPIGAQGRCGPSRRGDGCPARPVTRLGACRPKAKLQIRVFWGARRVQVQQSTFKLDSEIHGASGRSLAVGQACYRNPASIADDSSRTTRQRSLGHPPLEAGTGAMECHCGAASGHWAVQGTSTHDRGGGRPILRQEHRPGRPCCHSTGPYFRARVRERVTPAGIFEASHRPSSDQCH